MYLHAVFMTVTSLTGGTFIDTQLYVFSRRTASGYVDTPQAVYASSSVLKHVSYFESLFSGSFAESVPTPLIIGFPSDQDQSVEYDYSSDSDLDDEEDAEDEQVHLSDKPPSSGGSADAQEECSTGGTYADEGSARDCGSGVENSPLERGVNNISVAVKDNGPVSYGDATGTVGRTVVIKDIAFKTFQAFVFYITPMNLFPPLCSPKSMYRLADKYDLQDLKKLAFNDIRSKLSADNILVELFSKYTSRYPDIHEMQTDFFCDKCLRSTALGSVPAWMERVAQGELPHSSGTLASLILKLASKLQLPIRWISTTRSARWTSCAKRCYCAADKFSCFSLLINGCTLGTAGRSGAASTTTVGTEEATDQWRKRSKKKGQKSAAPPIPSMSLTRQQISQCAFNSSIVDRSFEDTKFFVFSRRSASGVIDTPRPLFANSLLMRKASSHFELLLNGNFLESRVTEMDAGFPSDKQAWTDDYDYDSDSDLEDYDDGEEHIQEGGPIIGGARHDVHDGSVDSSMVAPPVFIDTGDEVKKDGRLGSSSDASDKVFGKVGKTVIIKDMAFSTWKAFIFYAYTGDISFAPLGSQAKFQFNQPYAYSPPLCSPKSMYRLADKYGINELKQRAANDIKSKLSADNILFEMFSRFTSRYSEIKDIQLDFFRTVSLQPVASSWPLFKNQARFEPQNAPVAASPPCAAVVVLIISPSHNLSS
ncbi:hypothetical protein A0H81_12855 [Grifola frondosa]|uniref:BTB domain-containing protein n=1 Tax=Grifola frondosa TaxID=5627 RepID=A0A1C7LRA9_GRIFR|nr:hypothetical protein A0H81_12855 [Grifola frondosa]